MMNGGRLPFPLPRGVESGLGVVFFRAGVGLKFTVAVGADVVAVVEIAVVVAAAVVVVVVLVVVA